MMLSGVHSEMDYGVGLRFARSFLSPFGKTGPDVCFSTVGGKGD